MIISPGLLEILEKQGGEEKNLCEIALLLSKYIHITVISPFYRIYNGKIPINDNLLISQVYFPSAKQYPVKTVYEKIIHLLSVPMYSILATLKVIGLKKQGARIVRTTNMFSGLLPLIISKILGIKTIYSEGNLWPWVYPYLSKNTTYRSFSRSTHIAFGKVICELADVICVQNQSILDEMVRLGLDREKIIIIPQGVDIESSKSQVISVNEIGQKPKVGFIGRLTDEKGVDILLHVIKEAHKRMPNTEFWIFGSGPYEGELKILPNVAFVGFLPREKLLQYLTKIPIFVFFQKALGNAELEAMANARIIIAPALGEVPSIIENGKNGILVFPNPESYIAAIESLMNNPELAIKLSENARKTAVEKFSYKRICCLWLELLKILENSANQ